MYIYTKQEKTPQIRCSEIFVMRPIVGDRLLVSRGWFTRDHPTENKIFHPTADTPPTISPIA